MELKTYQQLVMADLRDYLKAVDRSRDIVAAYNNDIPGVPHVCIKVPTGGGKTYLACCLRRGSEMTHGHELLRKMI